MVEHRKIIGPYLDPVGGRYVHPRDEVIRLNRQFPPASIRDDRQFDAAGPSVVQEGIERGSNGAAGIQDIIDENDSAPGNLERNDTRAYERVGQGGRGVISIKGNVYRAQLRCLAGLFAKQGRKPFGDGYTASADPYESQWLARQLACNDLLGHARQSSGDGLRVDQELVGG